ncbi:MAG: 4-hydroxy-3-methylbut-2-enyl diphosphate reductase [Candidatus Hydrogenedentota bacterium]|nr:MAG: 4-hydroxy-3-methylbut-2-enyl diphosphate reductase [Candidatus Hydrogenedentota bacterium]
MKRTLKVYVSAPRGFCAGVDRAIDVVEKCLELFPPPIYVRHEIVHNRFVVERLRRKGVVFVENLDDVPDGAVLIFSAHGVSRAVREEAKSRPLRLIDATCPLVTKVHLEVHRLAKEGYDIILIGHAGHVEVEGTMGQLPPGGITLVQKPADVERLEVAHPEKIAYVTQTTLSIDETSEVVAALKKRFPAITGPHKNDICYATQNRQNAVKALLGKIDLLLVIGSQNSSNSNRLVEVARAAGVSAYLFDHPDEMKAEWFENVESVGLTAGASAPEDIVEATKAELAERFDARFEEFRYTEESIEFNLPKELAHISSPES